MEPNRSSDSRDTTTWLLDGPDEWIIYPEHYWAAAENLLDTARTNSLLIHPGLFVMRHYVELFLKRRLHEAGSPVPDIHNLAALWARVRLLDEVATNPHVTADVLSMLDEATAALTQIDPKGETFRFPVDKHGQARGLAGKWFSARDMLEWSRLVHEQLGLLDAAEDMAEMDREAEREMAEYYAP